MPDFSKQETDVVRAMLGSPEAKALAEKRAREVEAERVTVAAELKSVEGRAGAAWVANERAIADATAAYEARRAALTEAEKVLVAAQNKRATEGYGFSVAIERWEARLRETAHPAIADFIAEMWSNFHETMKAPAAVVATNVVRNINTGKRQEEPGKSVILPKHRMEAIREVIAKAEGLKLVADQGRVVEHLAELRASIPAVGADIPEKSNLDALMSLIPGRKAA